MNRALLFYAGTCGKCVFLSRIVTLFAMGRIERRPLEGDAMYDFFLRQHPRAKGYPVLVVDGVPAYGARVFVETAAAVVRSWFRRP